MTTYDYETAWTDVYLPAYKQLSGAVHLALSEVATTAADLRQLPDCSMPWPEDGGKMRELFERIESEELARAAAIVHGYGHSRPGDAVLTDGTPEIPGREHGSYWKFAHYADQLLRARLDLPARGTRSGWGFEVHEGAIRLTWSDPRSWSWIEIAPATPDGFARAQAIRARIDDAINAGEPDKRMKNARGNIRWREMEAIKTIKPWPDLDTSRFMVDEAEMEARRAARRPEPDRAKLKARVIEEAAKEIRHAEIERDGRIWLIDHGFPTDNAIYYTHTGRWAFGWRREIPADLKSRMLDQLSEFPFDYDFASPRS